MLIDTKTARRAKYAALVIAIIALSSIGGYTVFLLEQNYQLHKENLRAVFYEQGGVAS